MGREHIASTSRSLSDPTYALYASLAPSRGERALGHGGELLPEKTRAAPAVVLSTLREPLEESALTISRAGGG